MPTPHIEAVDGDIAKIVIMPGDPKRCEYIAKKFLKGARLINKLRGATAYTGYFKNVRVTLFPSGMGIPSMGIYSNELFDLYNVDIIIRIGTAGSYSEDLKVYDLFLVDSAYSNTNYDEEVLGENINIINSSLELNTIIDKTSKELGLDLKRGRAFTTDAFYSNSKTTTAFALKNACSVVEMESFALFLNAKKYHKRATSILTITDEIYSGNQISAKEREIRLNSMINLVLESIIKIEK